MRIARGFILAAALAAVFLASPSGMGKSDSDDFWREVLEKKRETMRMLMDGTAVIFGGIDKKAEDFDAALKAHQKDFYGLKFTLTTSMFNPYEYGLVYSEIKSLQKSYAAAHSRVRAIRNKLKDAERMLRASEEELDHLRRSSGADLAEPIDQVNELMRKFGARVSTHIARLDKICEKGEAFEKTIDDSVTGLKERMPETLKSFLFAPKPGILNNELWLMMPYSFKRWAMTLGTNLRQKLPSEAFEWAFMAMSVLLVAPLYWAARLWLRRRLESMLGDNKASADLFVRGLGALMLGAALWAGSVVLEFPETILPYWTGLTFFFVFCMDFSWGLRRILTESAMAKSPLRPLFWLYVCGTASQILSVEYSLFIVAWPLFIGGMLAWLARMLRRESPPTFERNTVTLTILLGLGLMAMSMSGHLFLSIFLTLAWLVTAIATQFGVSVTALVKANIARKSQDKQNTIFHATLLYLCMPMFWMLLVWGIIQWCATQVGEYEIVSKMLHAGVDVHGTRIDSYSVGIAVIMFFVFLTAGKILCMHLDKLCGAFRVEKSVLPSLQSLTTYALWSVYLIMLFNLMGISVTSLMVVLGGVSVGIGLGLQNIVNNFISGLLILFGRTLHPGDVISMDAVWATVQKINIRSTTVQTFDNAIIAIPNADIIASKITNWTRNDNRIRREITVSVAFDSDMKKVESLLMEAAMSNTRVEKQPKHPKVYLSELGKTSVQFTLEVWIIDVIKARDTLSELRNAIMDGFNKAGVRFSA